ncbi:MAG: restriction endonuclease subunit S [Candidatus Parcubacteria bacterium]|nr:restriction endonuclease subunit S [Candidatus Parcubacteria bacterium]
MKTNWQTKKLGEICDILDNQRKPVTQRDRISGKYPYYGATGIQDYVSDYIFDEKLILVGEDGAKWGAGENTSFIATGKYWVNNHAHVIRPHRNKVLDNWIIYFLNVNDLSKYVTGLTVQKLNQGKLREIKIPLPPLPEQHRIVKILDEVFEKIEKAKENTEKNLQNSCDLFESYLQSVLENKREVWEEETLKELTTILGDGLHGTPKYTINGDYYFINGNNLTNGVIEFKENTKRVSIDEYNKYKKNLSGRSVLVSINGTLGNVAFYNGEKIILGKSACYFNLKEGIDKNFIKYVITSPLFLKYAHKEATGATIKNVSLKTMREFKIPLPSLETQHIIVQQLDELSEKTKNLEAIYKQKLADLEELKKSILGKAFAGEL